MKIKIVLVFSLRRQSKNTQFIVNHCLTVLNTQVVQHTRRLLVDMQIVRLLKP